MWGSPGHPRSGALRRPALWWAPGHLPSLVRRRRRLDRLARRHLLRPAPPGAGPPGPGAAARRPLATLGRAARLRGLLTVLLVAGFTVQWCAATDPFHAFWSMPLPDLLTARPAWTAAGAALGAAAVVVLMARTRHLALVPSLFDQAARNFGSDCLDLSQASNSVCTCSVASYRGALTALWRPLLPSRPGDSPPSGDQLRRRVR